MNIKMVCTSFCLMASVSHTHAWAQPGPRSGPGPQADRNMQFDESNVTGWSMMTSEERHRYHERMMTSKNFDDCLMIQKEQHSLMQARAQDRGARLVSPSQNACERMRERGLFN